MAEFPLVSIITPSFNQAPFLAQTIQSVLAQNYPNLEYWVIDGGSTDGSVDIIQRYADNLTGWLSERDQGQGDAINKGFRRSQGEILAWLNSDDLYRPGAIRNAVAVLQAHPQVGLVYSDVDSIDTEGEVFNRMTYGQWGLKDLMAFHMLGQVSVFFRRSVLEKAGLLDISYHYLLDHHLWLRMASHTRLKYVPGDVWGAARMHPGAKNVALAEKFGEEAYRLVNWMENNPQFDPYYDKNRHAIWAGAHRLNAFYLLDGGYPGKTLKYYWRAFWHHPSTALNDWRRIGYALLSPFKLSQLPDQYRARRKQNLNRKDTKKTKQSPD